MPLIVHNCYVHTVCVDLKAIKLVVLSLNTTATLLRMDQGIVKNVKLFHMHHMLERLVLYVGMNEHTVTLFMDLHMLVHAWDQFTAATVANCCRRCSLMWLMRAQARKLLARPGSKR